MSVDLVQRLRQRYDMLSRDAADEIERLRKVLVRITESPEEAGIGIAERALKEKRPPQSWGND